MRGVAVTRADHAALSCPLSMATNVGSGHEHAMNRQQSPMPRRRRVESLATSIAAQNAEAAA